MLTDEELFRDCLLFIQMQSAGEWGEAVETSDAKALMKFVKKHTSTRPAPDMAAVVEALEPLARLEIPSKPQGNAGCYSIYHKNILAARAALQSLRDAS